MELDQCDILFDKALCSKNKEEFSTAIDDLFSYYSILSVGLDRADIFWRARPANDATHKNVIDMKYPPKDIAGLGRLNDKGSPCFYAASNIETALLEIDAEGGKLYQVAGYRVLLEENLRLALIGEYANVQKSGYLHLSGVDPNLTITKMLNKSGENEARRKIYIDKFFAHILSDIDATKNEYCFSRALSSSIYSRVKVDGVAYPSVKDPGGLNVAINPTSFDRIFHNVSCLLVHVSKIRKFKHIDFTIIKSAKYLDDQDNFVWEAYKEHDIHGMYGLTEEEFEYAKTIQNDPNALILLKTYYNRKKSQH